MIHTIFKKLTAYRLKKKGRPDLIPILTPNFNPGCKRIAKSENYLEALASSNVTVVPRAITETYGNTIIDADGRKEEVEVLILATGFETEGFVGNLKSKYTQKTRLFQNIYGSCIVKGRQGLDLADLWTKSYPDNYKQATIHGFPNFFLLLGANTGLGHNSVVINIEWYTHLK